MTGSFAAGIVLSDAGAPRDGRDPTAWRALPRVVAVVGIVATLFATWVARERWDHAVRNRMGAMASAKRVRVV
jgi:hypothetical protein